jgi:large subunit ribosomal protein L44
VKPTKQFIQNFILSKVLPGSSLLYVATPKLLLTALLKKQQKEPPVTRLLKESGRLTHSPVFVVGIFSGNEKLAEGYGSSLRYAERAAVKSALIKHFAVDIKNPVLPSDIETDETMSYINESLVEAPPIV